MSSPADPSGCTGLSWTYDAWANRTNQTVTSGTCGQSALGINPNNQITNTGFSYDANGNSIVSTNQYGANSYQFDAENRITQFGNGPAYGGDNYIYDANGRRIEKITSTGQVHYFYNEDGHVVVETDQNGNWVKGYVYMGGQHVAEFSGGQTYWIHTDHLGSTRTITSYQGYVAYDYDYLPYGEQLTGGDFTTHLFTGYERDYESTLDYANARYYSSSIGRFMSVDPAPITSARHPFAGPEGASADPAPIVEQAQRIGSGCMSNPETLNRFAYVLNNPLTLRDPSGMSAQTTCQANCNLQLSIETAVCIAGTIITENPLTGTLCEYLALQDFRICSNACRAYGITATVSSLSSVVAAAAVTPPVVLATAVIFNEVAPAIDRAASASGPPSPVDSLSSEPLSTGANVVSIFAGGTIATGGGGGPAPLKPL